jgi:hypothetical protein
MSYEIKLFDTVQVICVDQWGHLKDILKTGIPMDEDLVVIEIGTDYDNMGRARTFYVCAEPEYPFGEYYAYVGDIYEINHPPEVFHTAADIYGDD